MLWLLGEGCSACKDPHLLDRIADRNTAAQDQEEGHSKQEAVIQTGIGAGTCFFLPFFGQKCQFTYWDGINHFENNHFDAVEDPHSQWNVCCDSTFFFVSYKICSGFFTGKSCMQYIGCHWQQSCIMMNLPISISSYSS